MGVKIWRERATIPTYGTGPRNKNPMFLERRVYQGSSGKVYPWPVIDKIEDEKKDRQYEMVFLENDYIRAQVMPEIGGRIYRATDKTNGYDFVYFNRVIKPALVGLTGPWISGGIEFNWPQHHRPNTFGPVEFWLDDSKSGSKTVWLSETDRICGTKATIGITLRDGFAAIEIAGQLYNPTAEPQTFLWWANPAVAAHDATQSIFPPDVGAVMDHGKRDVSRFPIATGTYYKTDYSKGVDISRYKNIPVPTSYMASSSDCDFVGGYDWRAGAGILHVADHHVSPGKKQWTWGCGEFGQAWDRNLTDEDGPYVELMAGVFTDNQPDFAWLAPYSGKSFVQYFMPYKGVGAVKCASRDLVAGLEAKDGKAAVKVYAARKFGGAKISLRHSGSGAEIYSREIALGPEKHFEDAVDYGGREWELALSVEAGGAKPIRYAPAKPEAARIPDPAAAIGAPETLRNAEALLLAGLHLEQYRHATYEPERYYEEGLKRDPGDLRLNNAYGGLLLRRGLFAEAQALFEAARRTAERHSPNPYDGEVFFNLGKAHELQGRDGEAFDAYYKAVWSDAWRSQGYLKLALIAARRGERESALEYASEAVWANCKNFAARGAAAVLNRLLGNAEAAASIVRETAEFDTMDLVAAREAAVMDGSPRNIEKLGAAMGGKAHNAMLLAGSYMDLGLHGDAAEILGRHLRSGNEQHAMLHYMLACALERSGSPDVAGAWEAAAKAGSDYCFPNTLREYAVLLRAVERNPEDAMAHYYLGCFLYDRKRYGDAKARWEACARLRPAFPAAHRNLALHYANKEKDDGAARRALETAFALDPSDSRVFYELCDLYKKIGMAYEEQYGRMRENMPLVLERDDLYIACVEALNGLGRHAEAIGMLMARKFHPWEGGEGKVSAQHVEARVGLARALIAEGRCAEAVSQLEAATAHYGNFGEGKLAGAQENNIYYTMGLAYKRIDPKAARECFEKASEGLSEPAGAMYYNDQPPHTIYYQGAALLELGRAGEAAARFNRLIDYGEKHMRDKQSFDYFAVSLPDFMVFDRDLDEKNRLHCHYMMGLGYMGFGRAEEASAAFGRALEIMPCHYGSLSHRKMLEAK
ncbi:MAG: DUF5107 domain-containing protein [Clostridiales bacterium]|jgi:tetratricopeptide (TPR) repeat protein|nr:DUF5107 domain-containing protein [Clostridiales bacterium]